MSPLSVHFCLFHAVLLGRNRQNNRSVPLPLGLPPPCLGNPGSTTGISKLLPKHFTNIFCCISNSKHATNAFFYPENFNLKGNKQQFVYRLLPNLASGT